MGYLDKSAGSLSKKNQHALIHCTCQACGSGWLVKNRFNGEVILLQKGWNVCKKCGCTNIRHNLREYNNEYREV